jgi:hypothetical protein
MLVLAYLRSQCTKFHTAGWTCWFFTSFYLESCIWPDAISWWIGKRVYIEFCSDLGTWLDKRSGKKAWDVHGQSKLTKTENGETRKCSSFSLTSRGLFTNNSAWQTKQWISHTTVTFYDDCLKMCEDFAPNFGDKRADCCITTTHCLTLPFSLWNLWLKTAWLSSPIHPTFLFPR